MQTVKNIVWLVGLFLLVSNCTKKLPLLTLDYAETKCSDPWMTNEGSNEFEVTTALMTYLENELSVPNPIIKINFDANEAEDCEACDCKSGRIITITVEEGFAPILEDNGFVLKS